MLSMLPETWCLKVSQVFYEGWAKVSWPSDSVNTEHWNDSWPSDNVNTEHWNEHFFENRDSELLHLDIFSDHTQNERTKFNFDRKLSGVWTLLRALNTQYLWLKLKVHLVYITCTCTCTCNVHVVYRYTLSVYVQILTYMYTTCLSTHSDEFTFTLIFHVMVRQLHVWNNNIITICHSVIW